MADTAQTKPADADKDFADFLGQLVEKKAENISDDLKFFGEKLTEQRDQHQGLAKSIQQAEGQLAQLRSQAIKLEGAMEQAVGIVRHFWSKDQGSAAGQPPKA